MSRSRLVGQLLIESLLLASLGAAAGMVVAQWGGQILRASLMPQVEWQSALADTRVLLFAATSAVIAGLLAGLAPIFQASRADVAATLKAGAREGHGQRSRIRTSLLVMQAALSVVLLVGAGLFVRSVQNVQTLRLGYDAEKLLWIEPHLRGVKLDSAQQVALRQELIARSMRNPAVESASLVMTIPFSSTYTDEVFAAGTDSVRLIKDVIVQAGSTSYFATAGTRIVRGRGFSSEDRAGAPRVAVVSQALARAAWPHQEAIGKCLRESADTMPCRTVVGVAEDIKLGELAEPGDPMFYLPIAQSGENQGTLFLRMRGNAAGYTDALRRELQQAMPGAAYVTAQPMSEVLAPVTRSWRLGATMFAVFGGLALLLASIGLYSVIAYSVTQRTHEMGVRLALGARVADVIGMIMRDGLRVVTIGIVLGIVAALAAGRWLAPLLFQVSTKDPFVYACVAIVLLGVAAAASWIPAMRASRVDPSTALRAD